MKIHYRHGPRLYPDHRPRTRGECFTFPRPCPFVSCRYHLAIDAHVTKDGNRKLRVLNDDPASMADTCALDIADGITESGWDDGQGMAEEHNESAEHVAELTGISLRTVHVAIERAQKRMRDEQARKDYNVSDERHERGLPARVVCALLNDGPISRAELRREASVHGVGTVSVDQAVRRMRLNGEIQSAHVSGRGAVYRLVGGGKAHLRDPGHPGKARGSD